MAGGLLRACGAVDASGRSYSPNPYSSSAAVGPHPGGASFPCGGELGSNRSAKIKKDVIFPSCQGKSRVAVAPAVAISPEKEKKSPLEVVVAEAAVKLLDAKKCWRLRAEMLIEKGVVGCQYFTLIAVAGSLIGSILCFLEGCFLVLESFLQYSHTMYQRVEQGGTIELLIQAIDMFLVGTALLTFGMGLYVMFAGSDTDTSKRGEGYHTDESNCFGSFNLKRLSDGMAMNSISHAKSKVGHAVVLILQAGVLDKFKTVPLTGTLDLACFAAAVFVSSACVFLLSKLS
ncbi:uncharacterized protein M6B38_143240 [Iris pallida]|uniref:Uncharacterized protein n=1 Tax=Iris pallida TaxID=29817 RepID=A0AAX6FBW3_IRIPA|nr:uncharacterized protein M6B38_143240 [Iris pallida]